MPPCLAKNTHRRPLGPGEWLAALPSEPFRIFFVIGTLAGIAGVTLWPLLYAGKLGFHPGIIHARVMIEGFGGAFAVGFLGTAMPRLLGAPRLRSVELALLLLLHGGVLLAHLSNHVVAGDFLFLAELLALITMMGARALLFSEDRPPASFALVGLGLLSALAGLVLLLAEPHLETSPFRYRLARLLLHEAFLLLPVLGIGAFLFPRFFIALPSADAPERAGAPGLEALACGFLLLASFVLEAADWNRAGGILRLLAGGAYLVRNVPFLRRQPGGGTLATCLRLAFLSVLLGLVAGGFLPTRRIALEHFLFIGGFGLLILSVATRVLLGHGGSLPRAMGKLVTMRWVAGLVLAALLTRVVADFVPKIMVSHHNYAALCWVAASIFWGLVFLPMIRWADPD